MLITYYLNGIEHPTLYNADNALALATAMTLIADLIATRIRFTVDYC